MSDLEQLDSEARARSLDPARSILLEAPAGSGKTTVLTQRILRLLACVDEPEEVLAITFTRKAAAEMRERVLAALQGGASAGPGATSEHGQYTRELAAAARRNSDRTRWELEENPARLRIQTIDSLNRSIASRLPIAARSGGGLEVHERAGELYRLAARRALEDAESMADLQVDTGLLFERLDNDWERFERLLAEMLARRGHWLPLLLRGEERSLCEVVERALESVITETLRSARARIPSLLCRQAGEFVAQHAPRDEWPLELGARAADLPQWRRLAALALTRGGEWRRRLSASEGFPRDNPRLRDAALAWIARMGEQPGARSALIEIGGLPPARLELADADALAALSRVLRFAAAELDVVFEEQGRVDHPYVAAAARRALTEDGDPTDLALRLGASLRHILIDEFQDTSSEQFELLRALTAAWEEGDGRTVFAVGDPMQSIYQFREAEVGFFLRARSFGLGRIKLEPLRLTRNFRSLPGLVEWSNATFARIFPSSDAPRSGAVAHAPAIPGRRDRGAAVVGIHRTDASAPGAEAQAVVGLIAAMRERDPQGSIAILVAARAHATPITSALRAAGIPVSGVDLVPLAEVPVVRDLAALTRALEHLGDRTAWLAVLRAPWCGLTLEDLAALVERRDPTAVWEALHEPARLARLNEGARRRVARVRDVLERAFAAQSQWPRAAWIESTWLALGGPSVCSDADELANAAAYLRALAERTVDGDGTAHDLEALLEALYARSAAAPADAVQIMTMHRAKGLEFDRVILPGLGRRARVPPDPLLRWLELPGERDGSDLLLAPCPASTARSTDPLNQFLKRLQRERADFERVRLLYVATTRARRELHLFGATSTQNPDQPTAGTLLGALWPVVGEAFRSSGPPSGPPPGPLAASSSSPAAPRRVIRRLADDWQPATAAPGPPFAGLRVANYEPRGLVEINWAGEVARHVGTVVHAALERVSRLPTPSLPEFALLEARMRAELAALGVAPAELGEAARRATQALQGTLADARGRWILDPAHLGAASELPLTGIHEGRLVSVVIDRCFIDAAGTRWVIDFKTSVARGVDLGTFLESELELYRPQIERYVALARRLGPQPVRAALYFPLLTEFREYPRDSG
jgi:ATP-dependent exoDNAse (exonuclease V) beta subunit